MNEKPESEFVATVMHYLGIVLMIVGNLILAPVVLAVYYGEPFIPYVIASSISLVFGFILFKKFKRGRLTLGRALVFGASAFAIMALIGATPYYLMSLQLFGELGVDAFVNSYFESMSGFTTTGLSTLSNIDSAPLSLLFWRSMTQWIGGIGVVVLFLTVLVGPGMSATYLFKSEAREDRLAPSIKHTVRGMVRIYLFYTIAAIVVLFLLGMPIFDAVNHAFTAVSTGGFSTHATSIESYTSWGLELGMIMFMIIGATSFTLHYKLLGWRWKELKQFVKNRELQALVVILLVFTVVLSAHFYFNGDADPVKHGAFQVVSAATTTGYTSMEITQSTDFTKSILILLMFIGGSAGSTAGGLKIIRLLMLLSSIPWLINRYLLPKTAILPLKVGGRAFSDREANQVSWYFFIYLLCIVGGTLVITAHGFGFLDSLFETTSAAATVGLSTGITAATAPLLVKVVLIFEMWIGRLEILPVLVWIGASIGNKRWSRFYR